MNTKLVKAPVYQQLNDLLRGLIRAGEFKAGERFLTERQIAERFEVSRATANKALSNLVSEGIVEFRKGLGTFVRPGRLDVDLRMLVSFTARAEAVGHQPKTRVLRFARTTWKNERARSDHDRFDGLEGFAPGDDEELFAMERLRLADAEPVILERRLVIARHCPGLDRKQAGGSLYTLWTKTHGLDIAGASQRIRAVPLAPKEATTLAVSAGSAALEVRATGRLASGEPLWWERTLYRGDVYAFSNELGQGTNAQAGPTLVLAE